MDRHIHAHMEAHIAHVLGKNVYITLRTINVKRKRSKRVLVTRNIIILRIVC